MSYPSIHHHLEKLGATIDNASDSQLRQAFISAFHTDLPRGFAKMSELVNKMRDRKDRAMLTLDPNSEEGKQFARLMAPDIPRNVLEDHFDCAFGFYNCCKGVAAPKRQDLRMTLKEQIDAQHPSFVDC
ncbi:MAG: hypothetical protein AAF228_13990 [Pseudomonadota bacterium]